MREGNGGGGWRNGAKLKEHLSDVGGVVVGRGIRVSFIDALKVEF